MEGLSNDELRNLILSVGTHRSDRSLSPVEVGELLHKAIEAGSTRSDCRAELQIGSTAIARFLRLASLKRELQHLADWGGSSGSGIAFSVLSEIARLPESRQYPVARAVLEHELTWNEVHQIVQVSDRSNQGIAEVIDEIIRLRPQIEKRHIFVGAVRSAALNRALRTLTQRQRDQALMRGLSSIGSGLEELVSGRLGTEQFTFVGPVNPASVLEKTADELEEELNTLLSDELLDDS